MNEVEGEVGQVSPHAPVISRPRHLRGTRYRGYDISRVHDIAVRDITWYDIFSKSYDGFSDIIPTRYHADFYDIIHPPHYVDTKSLKCAFSFSLYEFT